MFKLSTGRKALSALAVAAIVGAAMTPMAASAKGGHRHGHAYGYGASALAGGLLIGAIAAGAANAEPDYDERECWIEKRRAYDGYGGVYIQKVRVCD